MSDSDTNAAIAVLAHRVEGMHRDVSELHDVLKELTTAVTKLAVVEERQAQSSQALERAFKVIEKLEERIDKMGNRVAVLERAEPMQRQTAKWVTAAVWGAAGLFGVVVWDALKAKLMGT